MYQNFILIPVLLPILAALVMILIPALRKNRTLRNGYVIGTTLLTTICTILAATQSVESVTLFPFVGKVSIAFSSDNIGKLFAVLTSIMWLVSSIYQEEYLKHEKDEVRYHFFFLIGLTALLGISLAGNLVTMYVFYEMMTLAFMPLVLHSLTKDSIAAAMRFLFYSMAGAFLALGGIFYLNRYLSSYDFIPGGQLLANASQNKEMILLVVFLMILGFGTKAGMFPLHGWLPVAHPEAPSPASALMSGNLTKMGVLAIIRVIYYIIGPEFIRSTWVQYAFLGLTLLTILMGSMMAYKEQILKKRLAYSSISQISYILFGIALLNQTAMTGALLHVVFHSIVKNSLFLVAGAIIYKTGKTKVKELVGIGKEMPIVMWCYTLASITLIGIPPTSAFLSKWYLALGSLESTSFVCYLGPMILIISALLTAGYLLPITIEGFFPGKDYPYNHLMKKEPNRMMTLPLILLAALAVLLGMFPTSLLHFIATITTTLF